MKKGLFIGGLLILLIGLTAILCVYVFRPPTLQSHSSLVQTPYDYPVKTGTEEWESLYSLSQRIEACRIPGDVSSGMSTEALAESVASYPLLSLLFAYDTYEQGYRNMLNINDALQAILSRDDAGSKLFRVYKNRQSELAAARRDFRPSAPMAAELLFIECLLAQPEIMQTMTNDDQEEFREEAVLKVQQGSASMLHQIQPELLPGFNDAGIDLFNELNENEPVISEAGLLFEAIANALSDKDYSKYLTYLDGYIQDDFESLFFGVQSEENRMGNAGFWALEKIEFKQYLLLPEHRIPNAIFHADEFEDHEDVKVFYVATELSLSRESKALRNGLNYFEIVVGKTDAGDYKLLQLSEAVIRAYEEKGISFHQPGEQIQKIVQAARGEGHILNNCLEVIK